MCTYYIMRSFKGTKKEYYKALFISLYIDIFIISIPFLVYYLN